MGQGELDSLLNLLLLLVEASNILVGHVATLLHLHHRDAAVRLGGQDIHHSIGVAVHGHRTVGLQFLSVEDAQYSDQHICA